jgi:UDP-N-acetylglucosamine diphosphorylase/glucosamine-1-phosphate N-acetyltransferase
LPQNICIFEDKKFSNFFPLSLSLPVFELRVGLSYLRHRIQEEFAGVAIEVICRDYLEPIMRLRAPDLEVNIEPSDETLFINGRLLCFDDELKEVIDKISLGHIATKGGYVVAAHLEKTAAAAFAAYIHHRISEETIGKLCEALGACAEGVEDRGQADEKAAKREKKASKKQKTLLTPTADEGTYEDVHTVGQDAVAEKLPIALTKLIEKHHITLVEVPEARLLSFIWQLIEQNPAVIADDFKKLPFRGQSEESVVYPGVHMIGDENIVIGEGAVVKPGVILDASEGPIAIDDGAVVMPNASIVGPVSIGARSIVKTGAKILDGTSIGEVCKIGGEVDSTIFGNYTNKQHDGFIGHSYLGEWVNIGAASNNSDLKNNYSYVRMWCAGSIKETGRQFLGTIIGDHTKTGINTLFNTGTVIGFNCNVYSSEMPPKFVPSFSWGHGEAIIEYDLTKAMQTAEIVMERRKIKFGSEYKALFKKIHELSGKCNRNI